MKISTRTFFEAAHRLTDYDGKCKRIHGHNWVVDIDIDTKKDLDKTGFVVDFGDIKKVVDRFDHMLVLKDCEENKKIAESIPPEWIIWTSFNPTCEEFVKHIKDEIVKAIKLDKEDVRVKVYETYKPIKTSYAEI